MNKRDRLPDCNSMTRRVAIGTMLSGLATRYATANPRIREGVTIDPGKLSPLVTTDNKGNQNAMIGFAVGTPQNCASILITKKDPLFKRDPHVFVTPEWIDGIWFFGKDEPNIETDELKKALVKDAQSTFDSKIQDAKGAGGCGYVSALVTLMKVSKASGKWTASSFSLNGKNQVFSLVRSPTPSQIHPGKWNPDSIFICDQQWDPTANAALSDAINFAKAHPATTICRR